MSKPIRFVDFAFAAWYPTNSSSAVTYFMRADWCDDSWTDAHRAMHRRVAGDRSQTTLTPCAGDIEPHGPVRRWEHLCHGNCPAHLDKETP